MHKDLIEDTNRKENIKKKEDTKRNFLAGAIALAEEANFQENLFKSYLKALEDEANKFTQPTQKTPELVIQRDVIKIQDEVKGLDYSYESPYDALLKALEEIKDPIQRKVMTNTVKVLGKDFFDSNAAAAQQEAAAYANSGQGSPTPSAPSVGQVNGTDTNVSTQPEPSDKQGNGNTNVSTQSEPSDKQGNGNTNVSTQSEPSDKQGNGTDTNVSTQPEPSDKQDNGADTNLSTQSASSDKQGNDKDTNRSTQSASSDKQGNGKDTNLSTQSEPSENQDNDTDHNQLTEPNSSDQFEEDTYYADDYADEAQNHRPNKELLVELWKCLMLNKVEYKSELWCFVKRIDVAFVDELAMQCKLQGQVKSFDVTTLKLNAPILLTSIAKNYKLSPKHRSSSQMNYKASDNDWSFFNQNSKDRPPVLTQPRQKNKKFRIQFQPRGGSRSIEIED